MNTDFSRDKYAFSIAAFLGIFSFAILLAYHNIADGDLWARLAQGASIWNTGHLIHKDVFAFTPVLPQYIDHEWGTGLILFFLLKVFGPTALLAFKILAAIAALILAILTGRLNHCKWTTLLFLAVPCAAAIFPGYVPVVRSHVVTYLFFAATLFCLEAMLRGRRRYALAVVGLMVLWVNTHGGFVAGLGIIGIYAIVAIISKKMPGAMPATLAASVLATFVNPYGAKFWGYLLPALAHPRTNIAEWGPMAMLGMDSFLGFRILFAVAIGALIVGWDNDRLKKSPQSIIILALTAYLALRHRRHAPFFGLAACVFLGPYLESAFKQIVFCMPSILRKKIKPAMVCVIIYGIIALITACCVLPLVSFMVLAPAGFYPVREADILMYAKAEGNVAVPLRWGDYIAWRLYPRIKISICGRYETMYPESTFEMNHAFFSKTGAGWDRIVRDYNVDYIMMELNNTGLKPYDLQKLNYEPVWSNGYSALYARKDLAPALREIAANLPPRTIEPLDAHIPDKW